MIKTVDELKRLIEWAKANKVSELKIADVSFKLSDLAHIESLSNMDTAFNIQAPDLAKPPQSIKLPDGNTLPSEDTEDLFWSAR
jgi:hypothetical protein